MAGSRSSSECYSGWRMQHFLRGYIYSYRLTAEAWTGYLKSTLPHTHHRNTVYLWTKPTLEKKCVNELFCIDLILFFADLAEFTHVPAVVFFSLDLKSSTKIPAVFLFFFFFLLGHVASFCCVNLNNQPLMMIQLRKTISLQRINQACRPS